MRISDKVSIIIEEDIENILKDIGERSSQLEETVVLITGAMGFLGSYFADVLAALNDKLLKRKCHIILVDNEIVNDRSVLSHLLHRSDVTFFKQDIAKSFYIKGPVDFIVHAASIASPRVYQQYPLETIAANFDGTRNILELAKKKSSKKVLFLSTSEIYGDPEVHCIPTHEEYPGRVSCTGPRACYDESKRLAETLCTVYHNLFNIPVSITRTFNAYGPRLKLSDGRVVSNFFQAALSNKPLSVYDRSSTRSFCYVSDNIRAQFLVMFSNYHGEVFNIGNNKEEITILDLANKINKLFNNKLVIEYKTPEQKVYITDNPKRRCPDTSKIEKK